LGSYCHHSLDHVHRSVAAVFAIGRNIRLRPSAGAILANPFFHAALLRSPDTTRENVADAAIVALKIAGLLYLSPGIGRPILIFVRFRFDKRFAKIVYLALDALIFLFSIALIIICFLFNALKVAS
jgi:hypothetical protein